MFFVVEIMFSVYIQHIVLNIKKLIKMNVSINSMMYVFLAIKIWFINIISWRTTFWVTSFM